MSLHYKIWTRLAEGCLVLVGCFLASHIVTNLTKVWLSHPSQRFAPAALAATAAPPDEAKLLHPSHIAMLRTHKPTPPNKPQHTQPTPATNTTKQYRPCDPKAPVSLSRVRWLLKGTIVAEPVSSSSATIYDYTRRRPVTLRVGQVYAGIKLCAIEARSIKIARVSQVPSGASRTELLVLGVSPLRLPKALARSKSLRRHRFYRRHRRYRRKRRQRIWRRRWRKRRWQRNYKRALSSIQRQSQGHYTMHRRWVRPLARHYKFLQRQATILPYFRRGQALGMRILRPKPNSIFRKLGLKSGDIVRSVNGIPLSSPQRIIRAYYRLRGNADLSVQIYRNGRHHTVRYSLHG